MKTRLPLILALIVAVLLASPAVADYDHEELMGRWDQYHQVAFFLRLFDDGGFRWSLPKRPPLEGRYRFLSGSVLELKVKMPNGRILTMEVKYKYYPRKKDALYLRVGNRWVTYTRAK